MRIQICNENIGSIFSTFSGSNRIEISNARNNTVIQIGEWPDNFVVRTHETHFRIWTPDPIREE